jgi:phosphomannomutase
LIELEENTFQCPGETYKISRSVHLGRLAAFDERCRNCAHRHDTGSLPAKLVKELQHTWDQQAPPLFEGDRVAGLIGEILNAATTRRLAAAFGTLLLQRSRDADSVAVVLAGDGRAQVAELVAAASDGLRWSGCQVIELPGASSACLVYAQQRLAAAGGLLVGNAAGTPRTAGLRLFSSGGQPLAAVAGDADDLSLAELRDTFEHSLNRPARRYGGWRRASAEQEYVASLTEYFHALRPLKFLLDTACAPLRRYLDQLLAAVACRAYSPAEVSQSPPGALHFSLWIDGDGERCRVSDEQGRPVDPEALSMLLAQRQVAPRSGDALHVLALLLVILSQSDRPLSAVVEQAASLAFGPTLA